MSGDLTGWIVEALVASTLLMALVLAARGPVARSFGPRVAYLLWLLPALRMVLPPLPAGFAPSLGLSDLLATPPAAAAVLPAATTAPVAMPVAMPTALPAVAAAPATDWGAVALVLWLAGAALFFGWQMLRYAHFTSEVLAKSMPVGQQDGLPIHASPLVDGPVAAGLLRRRIFVPADFDSRFACEEQRLALMHEAAHHRRLDILANAGALAMLALHWFNPLAHMAYRAFRADQELACDATVLAGAEARERHAYGVTLVKSTWGGLPAGACAMNTGDQLKRRLKMMTLGDRSRPRTAAGALLTLAIVGGGLVLTASGGIAAKPEPVTIIHGDGAVVNGVRRPLTPEERRKVDHAISKAREAVAKARDEVALATEQAVKEQVHATAHAEMAREAAAVAAEAMAEARVAMAEANVHAQVAVAMAEARGEMVARCKAEGKPVDADEQDWGALAMCGRGELKKLIATSLEAARAGLAASSAGLSEAERRAALAGIDAQIAAHKAETR